MHLKPLLLSFLALSLSAPVHASERHDRRRACDEASQAESHALACWRLGRARPHGEQTAVKAGVARPDPATDARQRRSRREWERARSRHESGGAADLR